MAQNSETTDTDTGKRYFSIFSLLLLLFGLIHNGVQTRADGDILTTDSSASVVESFAHERSKTNSANAPTSPSSNFPDRKRSGGFVPAEDNVVATQSETNQPVLSHDSVTPGQPETIQRVVSRYPVTPGEPETNQPVLPYDPVTPAQPETTQPVLSQYQGTPGTPETDQPVLSQHPVTPAQPETTQPVLSQYQGTSGQPESRHPALECYPVIPEVAETSWLSMTCYPQTPRQSYTSPPVWVHGPVTPIQPDTSQSSLSHLSVTPGQPQTIRPVWSHFSVTPQTTQSALSTVPTENPFSVQPDQVLPSTEGRITATQLSTTAPSFLCFPVMGEEGMSTTTPNDVYREILSSSSHPAVTTFGEETTTSAQTTTGTSYTEMTTSQEKQPTRTQTLDPPVDNDVLHKTNQSCVGLQGHLEWDSLHTQPRTPVTWTIRVPPHCAVTIKIFHIQVSGKYSLGFHSPGHRLRKYTVNEQPEGFSPLLTNHSSMSVVVKPAKRGACSFNISYFAHPVDELPIEERVKKNEPRGSRREYHCQPYVTVPRVFMCDMTEQCVDDRDEAGCEYKKDGTCGHWVPYGDYCLKGVFRHVFNSDPRRIKSPMPIKAEKDCESEYDATLAILPDKAGMKLVADMIRHSGFLNAVVGLKKVRPTSARLRHLYRFIWQWGHQGSPIAYEQQAIQRDGPFLDCTMMDILPEPRLRPLPCAFSKTVPEGYVCMKKNPARPKAGSKKPPRVKRVDFSEPYPVVEKFPTKRCADGSLVHVFHRCLWDDDIDPDSSDSDSGWSPGNLPLFKCRFGQNVHYTLVCDGNGDCADRSDEQGCGRPRLGRPLRKMFFVCRSGQAVPKSHVCNGVPDCFDETDEEDCVTCQGQTVLCTGVGCIPIAYEKYVDSCPDLGKSKTQRPQLRDIPLADASVRMDGLGMSTLNNATTCSEREFQCFNGLCIPAFLLNNGEQDCLHGEDENIAKENLTCPGFYRCQEVGLCVHIDYVCDGVYHCPNKDDERYCDLKCPDNCTCEGHAYTCQRMFRPRSHLLVRYLDLSGTPDPSLQKINNLEYLQFLNLSVCGLTRVGLARMPQLRVLDLSYNALKGLHSLVLNKLTGLTRLDLSGNPLVETLDASFRSFLEVSGMTGLQVLKMMNTEVSRMEANVFDRLSRLTSLDLRGNRVVKIDEGVFRGLSHLRVLSSDNHKLCCSYFHNRLTECNAPEDELSSCSDLLRLDFFRLFLWSVSILAISGNVGCLVYRCCYRRQTASLTTRVLLTNLAASDLLMGVYMMMIGAADSYYRGVYVSKEVEWRESIMCKVAGVVAFVSCEVSSFVIFLVTLDRFLVLCFPLKRRIHLTARSALSACSVAWGVGVALAVVPLVTQWEFYGQSGICLPLPITRQQFKGQDFAFGVFIFLNANLFLLIGAAQVCIYRSVRATGCEAGTSCRQQESAIARRLFVVVGTDFLCWFPIGLMGLLASSGTPIPGVVNVWVAIFLLPINSALNPFLYTLNGLADRWRRQREEKRMKEMIGKLNTEIPNWSASTVKELTKICLRSKLVTRDLVLRWLGVREAVLTTGHALTTFSEPGQPRAQVSTTGFDTYVSCGLSSYDTADVKME